jgi:UDP-N-acetyl-D-glucosamine dehydrogenase
LAWLATTEEIDPTIVVQSLGFAISYLLVSTSISALNDRIRDRKARIGIIGLGYVGLPLAVEFARAGFDVTGFDVDEAKPRQINAGTSYIPDVPSADLARAVSSGTLRATTDMRQLGSMDVIDICVPTPLRKTKDPDLSYVVKAVEAVAATLRVGQLVILESTTYPGTTDEVVQPRLEAGGLKADVDFLLAFSPERVDPGNALHTTRTIPKVVGGVGVASTEAAGLLYSAVVANVVTVSSTRVAEMVKLLENTFRAVNIGLVNEIALMCHKMDLDVWEVIDAAGTKPFGFMPFYPGPGLGGHCIPIDPFYLSWKARQTGFECRFIELAGQVNGSMPEYVVQRIGEALNSVKKPINGSKIHLFGVAYKRDVNDVRESPALDVLELLVKRGADVSYTDPHVARFEHAGGVLTTVPFEKAIGQPCDCAVVTTDHTAFDYPKIAAMPLVVDTRNALKAFARPSIFRL